MDTGTGEKISKYDVPDSVSYILCLVISNKEITQFSSLDGGSNRRLPMETSNQRCQFVVDRSFFFQRIN